MQGKGTQSIAPSRSPLPARKAKQELEVLQLTCISRKTQKLGVFVKAQNNQAGINFKTPKI